MPLPRPTDQQREVLYLPAEGHTVVLGTAGSGKTTLAILRAAHLASDDTDHRGNTLLLTYNRALVAYFEYLKGQGDLAGVIVENYHKFARGYLSRRGLMAANCICGPDDRLQFIQIAVDRYSSSDGRWEALKKRGYLFFSEEIAWIQRQGVRTVDAYERIERTGRATPLTVQQRRLVFDIYDSYQRIRSQKGRRYDWEDIALRVSDAFDIDQDQRRYRHIVIDEGQDFSPEMIRSLVKAAPSEGSVTFFGDTAQQIYGRRTSWRSAGLNVLRVWEFRHNFRNSAQIANFARAITEMPHYAGVEDLVVPETPTAEGPLPTLVKLADRAAEIELITREATKSSKNATVAILFRKREDEMWVMKKFPEATRLHRDLALWSTEPGVFYGTYHSAKGLEFDVVMLPFLTNDRLPSVDEIAAHGPDEAAAGDAKLLYVGCTRARKRLILTYHGTVTSLIPVTSKHLQQLVM